MKTNLKAARKNTGMTQAQAAELSGIPIGTIRRWEQGVHEPDMASVVKLAALYGVSTDTILGSDFAADMPGIVKVDEIESATEERRAELISAWDALNDENKTIVERVALALLETQ